VRRLVKIVSIVAVVAALYRGEELTPLQQQLVSTYPSFEACLQASVE
jgi:hypothetical protein